MIQLKEGLWTGKPAIIVGGGPSLRSFDWSILSGAPNIIVVNRAFENVPTADIFYTQDIRFVTRWGNTDGFKNFAGLKVVATFGESARPLKPFLPQLTALLRKSRNMEWSNRLSNGLARSSNSGIGALNLACILGANPIYVLGFDCRGSALGPNYHDDYPAHWRASDHTVETYRADFERLASTRLKDKHIVNVVNPELESAITCWQKLPFDMFRAVVEPVMIFRRQDHATEG